MNSFHSRDQRPRKGRERRQQATPQQRPGGMMRADALLVSQGLAASRAQARRAIEDGRVLGEHGPVGKPGQLLDENDTLSVSPAAADRFVSRGGLKLDAALSRTGIDVRKRVCLDIGQSTGGFSDCLLQHGAAQVIGIEVGHDQLHAQLRDNPACITLEGINARTLTPADLGQHMPAHGFDLIVCDASFISLTLLLPQWPALLHEDGNIITLIKPQFEVGREGLGRHGVVRDNALYATVESRIRQAAQTAGLSVQMWMDSPITGGGVGNTRGNREFLAWLRRAEHNTNHDKPS